MTAVRFFQDARAIESLRESDFDTVSAYGEVIDNSLEAGATEVKVKFVTEPKRGREQILSLAFGDNGSGMTDETLHNCLTIGWSSRYNSRSGIGRFGVGMTLGAIHECRRVEVWTKVKGGDWRYTYMDLDEISNGQLETVPAPVARVIPSQYKDLVGAEHGTLVVWKKYDRQLSCATNIAESFSQWAGRTYRYYIWGQVPGIDNPIEISINGNNVYALDPLYSRIEKTRFPDDPKSKVFEEIALDWPIDSSVADSVGATSKIRILLSQLPEEWRLRIGSGGSAANRARFLYQNEGISILRNYREVFYGTIPHWKDGKGWPRFEEVDRFWGCEVHFSAEIDRAFQVKNIKRGAVPRRELKVAIKGLIQPTRETVLDEVRTVWAKTKQADAKAKAEAESTGPAVPRAGGHTDSEGAAAKASVPANSPIDEGKDLDSEADKLAESYADEYDKEQQQALAALFKSQPFTIMHRSWKGIQFFEPHFIGGKAVLDFNTNHRFFAHLDCLLEDLENEEVDPVEQARSIKGMIDVLIMAHAKAEAQFAPDASFTAEQFSEYLQTNWGQYLNSYIQALQQQLED